jgi:dihydrofolate synthase/folylpolyglutamate synthase
MLAVLTPHFDRVIITRSQSDRAADPEKLATLVERTRGGAGNRQVACVEEPLAALAEARAHAARAPGGLVVVAGSIFLVGALRAHLQGISPGEAEASDPLP